MKLQMPDFFLLFVFASVRAKAEHFIDAHFDTKDLLNIANSSIDNVSILESVIQQKLRLRQRTIFDASRLSQSCRIRFKKMAKKYHCPARCLVLKSKETSNLQHDQFIKTLKKDGFKEIEDLKAGSAITINIGSNPNDKSSLKGPFDIIGDVHGCYKELCILLDKLGYQISYADSGKESFTATHLAGRKLIFVGDLVDKGPDTPDVIRLALSLIKLDMAYCVLGNHEAKLLKKLEGRNVTLTHGLDKSVLQFEKETPAFQEEAIAFIESLPHHLVFDDGNLVIAHAGIQEQMILRDSGTINAFCLYGETTGKLDADGLPERKNWALQNKGKAIVVHGHVPVLDAVWLNNVLDIDTGCVYGGSLTALRYPEMDLVKVPALDVYSMPKSGKNPFRE